MMTKNFDDNQANLTRVSDDKNQVEQGDFDEEEAMKNPRLIDEENVKLCNLFREENMRNNAEMMLRFATTAAENSIEILPEFLAKILQIKTILESQNPAKKNAFRAQSRCPNFYHEGSDLFNQEMQIQASLRCPKICNEESKNVTEESQLFIRKRLHLNQLNNETDSVTIFLLPLKRQLAGPQVVEVVKLILNAQPDCTVEQLMQMGLGFFNGELTLCKPPEEMMGLATPLIESQLQFMVGTVPDEVTLISRTKSNTPGDPRIRLNLIRAIMKWTPFFPVMFMIGITVFAVRSLADWLKWCGIPLLITGILGVVAALLSAPLTPWMLETMILHGIPNMPIALLDVIGSVTGSLTREILQPVFIQAMILTLAGAGMAFIFWIINMNKYISMLFDLEQTHIRIPNPVKHMVNF